MTSPNPWSDEPIANVDEDSFSRGPFARLLAQVIDRVEIGAASTVFGLVGRWGSGKSSVAAMVGQMLPDTWIVQSFTPWAASGTAALQLEFVAALDAALGGGLAEKEGAKSALRKYTKWASPVLAAVPVVGQPLADAAQAAIDDLATRQPWSLEFGELAQLLKTMEKRVLIVCDDIDRLDAVELLEFLKVVRLLGRFPNVHYLVAYDADTVEDLLASEGIGGRTSSFMEKIVQHPFELPQIDVATRWRHISSSLTRTLDEQSYQLDEPRLKRYRLLIDALTVGLVTPRQIARYESHISVLSTLVPGEVDILDFAALANLRLNHHEIYEALPKWAPDLGAGLKSKTEDKGLTEVDWIARLRATSRRTDVTGAWDSVCFLFPEIQAPRRDVLHPQAFSNWLYTERYYSLGVPENDVSDVMVARAISSLLGREPDNMAETAVLETITTAHTSIARLAFNKLREQRRTLLGGNDAVEKLVMFLLVEYKRVESSRSDRESTVDIILDWLSDEVLRGYGADEFTRDGLLERFGEDLCFDILRQVGASWGSILDENTEAILADFTGHFVDALAGEGRSALEPLGSLRFRLSLVARTKGPGALTGLLDRIVDGDVAAFELVAIAMVNLENWTGFETKRQKLGFDTEEWRTAISIEVRERMAALLTEEFDSYPIDIDDVSDSNRRRLAIFRARSEFGFGGATADV